VRIAGPVPVVQGAHVVTFVPPHGMAAGAVPWGIAGALHSLDPATTAATVDESGAATSAARAAAERAAAGRPLVVVTRDAHRHPWQAALLEALMAARPDLVHVEMGWPSPAAPCAATTVMTFGASRASGEAVARLLAGARR
jgi:beta-N-acetylhexosaminidase